MNEIAVYTANTGGHDYQQSHAHLRDDVDYLYLTDGIVAAPSGWKEVRLPRCYTLDNRRLSKLPKSVPHQFLELRDYRYLIWIDADMSIARAEWIDEILLYMKNGWVMSPHFDQRDDAYSEITASGHPKYHREPFVEQENYYRNIARYPGHTGLWETGVSARDMTNPLVQRAGDAWWFETVSWSYQDQVTLPYALWKVGFVPDTLPQSWRDYNWLNLTCHAREDV